VKSIGLPIAMRFRNLKERASKDLVVLPSHIHGRGLYARRDIEVGEMLIEYAGEVSNLSQHSADESKIYE
jgi:SET domain-containing protein